MPWPYTHRPRPRVVVAGGGPAALEACLAMRARVRDADVEIVLLATDPRFEYRPLAMVDSLANGSAGSLRLESFAADCDVALVDDALVAVGASARVAITASGTELPYDVVLVAVGGRAMAAVPGALTFRGPGDLRAFRALRDAMRARARPRIVFCAPAGASWPLPLCELALMTAAELRDHGADPAVTVTVPQPTLLDVVGGRASEFVASLLRRHGIALLVDAEPVAVDGGGLELRDGRRVEADGVVALPRIAGRRLGGLPQDDDDFLPVDDHQQVDALRHVYAAGDITSFPLKHAGIATQQADAAADAMLSELGVPVTPRPFRPVLQGVLHDRHEPSVDPGRPTGRPAPRTYSLWFPPSKASGQHLAPYLAIHAGAPRTPEWPPGADIVPVRVEVGALGRSPV
ncbi:MAG: FAD-dependent oxidoreductase [Solirubrobacteraceae bacterium]